VRQFSPAVIVNVNCSVAAHVSGVDHTHVHVRTCTWVVPCGRGRSVWEHGYHLSLFDVCSVADWSLIMDRRPENSMDLMLLRLSCKYAHSEVITVNSDYTCCAEHLMLNLKDVGTKDG